MVDPSGPRHGSRDNGLRAERYVAVADLDPRVADTLLDVLRDRGIAAYAAPASNADPVFRSVSQPTLSDRLYVDAAAEGVARSLVAAEAPEDSTPLVDEDAAWRSIVAGLSAAAPAGERPWPAAEDTEPAPFRTWTPAEEPEDEHFEPPPPPPLPRFRPTTVLALLAVAAGVLLLFLGDTDEMTFLGVVCILGGFGTLVYRMRDPGPDDDDPDAGAVV